MDERIQKYEEKMKKTLASLSANWLQFVQDVRTRISLTNSP